MKQATTGMLAAIVTACASSPPATDGDAVAPRSTPRFSQATATRATGEPAPAGSGMVRRERHTEWHSNGLKHVEGTLVDGQRDGSWCAWDASGCRIWEAQYRHGLLDGTYTIWEQGLKRTELDFVADDLRRRRRYSGNTTMWLESDDSFLLGRRDGPCGERSAGKWTVHYRSCGEVIPDPNTTSTSRSAGYWLKHAGTGAERLEAVRSLASYQPLDVYAIEDLMLGLADQEPGVVRECVTMLGIAGAAAEPAMTTLARLAQGNDRGLSEIARKAMQQVRAVPAQH